MRRGASEMSCSRSPPRGRRRVGGVTPRPQAPAPLCEPLPGNASSGSRFGRPSVAHKLRPRGSPSAPPVSRRASGLSRAAFGNRARKAGRASSSLASCATTSKRPASEARSRARASAPSTWSSLSPGKAGIAPRLLPRRGEHHRFRGHSDRRSGLFARCPENLAPPERL